MLTPSEQITQVNWDTIKKNALDKVYKLGVDRLLEEDYRLGTKPCKRKVKYYNRLLKILERDNCYTKNQIEKILSCEESKICKECQI